MNFVKSVFLLITASFLINFNSFAGLQDNLNTAIGFHKGTINDFEKLEMGHRTQHAMDFMVETAAYALEIYGYKADADQVRKEWQEQFAYEFLYFADDLGDHRPLSKWFADLYKKLRVKFGDQMLAKMHLDDVNTLNFAIPVSFQPKGDKQTGETWDLTEYKLHFVPFATIVTYWGSYGACTLLTKEHPGIRKYCKNIANVLRLAMREFAAPKLSDYIFKTVNKTGNGSFAFDEKGMDEFLKNEFEKIRE